MIVTYTEDYARNTPSLAKRISRVRWILPPVVEPRDTGRSEEDVRARYGIRGIPVLLFLGVIADTLGIETVMYLLAAAILGFSWWAARFSHRSL